MTDVQPSSPPAGDEPAPAFTAADLARVTGGRLVARSDRPIRGAAVDSRLVEPGQLFVALPGERTDGHAFLGAAVERGAAALLVTRPPADPAPLGDVTIVRVGDALAALQAAAAGWRLRFDPLVVGVTGSIAKTSTKEAVATVLAARYRTLKTEGNQNNEIGLPLTVLGLGREHEAAVLEMGMYVGGEIRQLAAIGRPQIGIVTAVQPVHLSRIGSIEAVERAKAELVEALPRDGRAILNADDPRVVRMAARTPAAILTYGFSSDADVRAADVVSRGAGGMEFTLQTPVGAVPARIPMLGRLAVHNALAAAAAGLAAGVPLDAIARVLAAGWSAPHRGELHRAGGITLVDDAYNASPASVKAALELLSGLPGRRVAVLGTMLELGASHESGHREVGEAAAGIVELLVVVGADAGAIADGARSAGLAADRVLHVSDRETALDALRPRVRDGDVILVKASRGIALDRLVEDLRRELTPAERTDGATAPTAPPAR
ncbi:MAG TPA: UDP-N-acetylmuramoyl-tripeptide--D-alanyl-D-alanine ligase [Vitreimonas sp.]|nr:UDP-N-acetylmuramoyl-tripeptide--D-alanyl-D-alanine ligase [Vitreimonas sp.]